MTIKFHFRPEENVVICVHKGDRTDDEFLAAYKSMFENDLFNISMNRLVDMRQAGTGEKRSSTALQQLAKYVSTQFSETGARPKVACIAPKDSVFGIARMYEAYSQIENVPWDLVVFRAVDAALSWLGLPDDFLDSLDDDTQ